MVSRILVIVGCLYAAGCMGQSGAERAAMRAFQKGKWEKGREKLDRVLMKNEVAPAAHYALAFYFFQRSHPGFDLDASRHHALEARQQFVLVEPKVRRRLQQFPLDSARIDRMIARIDSAGFARARQEGTEEAYNFFLEHFEGAAQADDAVELRDSTAFAAAEDAGTHQAMAAFLHRYPQSRERDKARAIYDRLLFVDQTGDQRLSSFREFLQQHPASPYRAQVEEQIFEMLTASGTPSSLKQYVADHPHTKAARKAVNILTHLDLEDDDDWSPALPALRDSLRRLRELNTAYLVPFLASGKYGFMDQRGKAVITTDDTAIYPGYLCGQIQEDVLVLTNRLIARDGSVIFEGAVEALEDLGSGFMRVETAGCTRVIHKSGFAIGQGCIEDAIVLKANFIALRDNNEWILYTVAGRRLFDHGWEDIRDYHTLIGLRKNAVWYLATSADLARVADQQPLYTTVAYDSVRAWPGDLVWVKSGKREGVMNRRMGVVIPLGDYALAYSTKAITAALDSGHCVYRDDFTASRVYEALRVNDHWITARQDGLWEFVNLKTGGEERRHRYDSIFFVGTYAAAQRRDSLFVYYEPGQYIPLRRAQVSFLPSKDSTSLLLVDRGSRKAVYDARGRRLFEGPYDQVQYAEENCFMVTRHGKKGLTDIRGKQLLPIVYDAIGQVEKGRVGLLRNMRFGLYDVGTRREIRPSYDKNLVAYNGDLLVAFREGKYGLVDWKNSVTRPLVYDELLHWNDTLALVRQDAFWSIIHVGNGRVVFGDIRSFDWVTQKEPEKTIIFRVGGDYGVLSSTRGVVIPAAFSDVINLGSDDHPLYFTEKHIEEAVIFVVIYYDENGVAIRRHAYDADEYDKIYCSGY